MITSLTVNGFRGLSKLALSNLSRVNVIVGPNASGKTALLEAIAVGCRASPQAALGIAFGRTQAPLTPANPTGFRAIWSGFFPNMDMGRAISISLTDSNGGRKNLRIRAVMSPTILGGTAQVQAPLNGAAETMAVEFDRTGSNGIETETVRSFIGPQGNLIAEAASPIGPDVALFPAFSPANEADNISWLSLLSIENREKEVLEILQQEFPQVERLDVLSLYGVQGIYVSYSGSTNKLPIGLLSAGIHKILTLILASLTYDKGVLLIDEIENGIFYRRYGDIWSMIHRLAVRRQNQLFVTSHSLECLRESLPAVQAAPQDFTLIRMEQGPGGITAHRFSGAEFAAALVQDVDPRGDERAF